MFIVRVFIAVPLKQNFKRHRNSNIACAQRMAVTPLALSYLSLLGKLNAR
jgi:hypothetical protein